MYLGNVVEVLPAKNLARYAKHPYTKALIGSVFDIHMDFSKPIESIEGDVPSPMDIPEGCPFQDRCPDVTARCREEKPGLREIDKDHQVACHLCDREK